MDKINRKVQVAAVAEIIAIYNISSPVNKLFNKNKYDFRYRMTNLDQLRGI